MILVYYPFLDVSRGVHVCLLQACCIAVHDLWRWAWCGGSALGTGVLPALAFPNEDSADSVTVAVLPNRAN